MWSGTIVAGSVRAAEPQRLTSNGRRRRRRTGPARDLSWLAGDRDGRHPSATQTVAMVADAFRITASDATPAAGRSSP